MKGSEIQNLVFSVSVLGYKKSDIKAFLREISEYVLKLENEVYKLKIEKEKLMNKLSKDEISQMDFKQIIKSAQEFKKRIEEEAQNRANEIIKKAKIIQANIIKSIDIEQKKLSLIKREVESVKKSILEKLDNFSNIIEMKEKNISTRESSREDEFKINDFDVKKIVDTERNPEETIEFSTNIKSIEDNELNEKNSLGANDNDYIKSRFKEIDLK